MIINRRHHPSSDTLRTNNVVDESYGLFQLQQIQCIWQLRTHKNKTISWITTKTRTYLPAWLTRPWGCGCADHFLSHFVDKWPELFLSVDAMMVKKLLTKLKTYFSGWNSGPDLRQHAVPRVYFLRGLGDNLEVLQETSRQPGQSRIWGSRTAF